MKLPCPEGSKEYASSVENLGRVNAFMAEAYYERVMLKEASVAGEYREKMAAPTDAKMSKLLPADPSIDRMHKDADSLSVEGVAVPYSAWVPGDDISDKKTGREPVLAKKDHMAPVQNNLVRADGTHALGHLTDSMHPASSPDDDLYGSAYLNDPSPQKASKEAFKPAADHTPAQSGLPGRIFGEAAGPVTRGDQAENRLHASAIAMKAPDKGLGFGGGLGLGG